MTIRHHFAPTVSLTGRPEGGYVVRVDFFDTWDESTDGARQLHSNDPDVIAACAALDDALRAHPAAVHDPDAPAAVPSLVFTIPPAGQRTEATP